LSWLADSLDLSVDVGGWVTKAREDHAFWLADIVKHWQRHTGLPVSVCGAEYKPETNLTTGSPSRLLHGLLDASWQETEPAEPGVFFIGCAHAKYATWKWPAGSVVVDPFGYIPDAHGVTVHRLGRKA
jgi:hypothetical protein